jgi:hypothetical protein
MPTGARFAPGHLRFLEQSRNALLEYDGRFGARSRVLTARTDRRPGAIDDDGIRSARQSKCFDLFIPIRVELEIHDTGPSRAEHVRMHLAGGMKADLKGRTHYVGGAKPLDVFTADDEGQVCPAMFVRRQNLS